MQINSGVGSTTKMLERETGKIRWFNHRKGYGFIGRSIGEDVFVHHTAIQMEGYRILDVGDAVVFKLTRGPKGLQAQDVVKVDAQ